MYTEVETITPEVAQHLLDTNDKNRQCNMRNVKIWASLMKQGKWQEDGAPIRVSKSGRLLDGQHRLRAVVESGTTQRMLMVYDLSEESFHVMDTGRSRTAGDVLHIAGVGNAKLAAATARMIMSYERSFKASATFKNQGRQPSIFITHGDILEFCQTVDLTEYLVKARAWYRNQKLFSESEYAFFFWVFSEKDKDDAINFLEALSTGINLDANSPIYQLRKRLLDYQTSRVTMSPAERFGTTVKCWNLFRNKETTSKYIFFNQEKESFPVPV